MSVGPIRDALQFQWYSMQVSVRNDKICVVGIQTLKSATQPRCLSKDRANYVYVAPLKTRNSSIADKPRDAFVQTQWLS